MSLDYLQDDEVTTSNQSIDSVSPANPRDARNKHFTLKINEYEHDILEAGQEAYGNIGKSAFIRLAIQEALKKKGIF